MEKGFGVLNEVPSVRTYEYGAVYGNADADLPKSFILPDARLPKVGDQGSIGACVAFAIAGILSAFHQAEFDEKTEFSEGFIYGYNRDDVSRYCGMYPQKTLDYMMKRGSVPKKYYNKLYEMPKMRDVLLEDDNIDTLAGIAEKYRIKGYAGFLKGEKTEIKQAIYDNMCPILGVSDKYFGGPHAIMIVGWDEDGFIIQNSWGEDWGSKGRKTIPLTAINYAFLLSDEVFELNFDDVKKDAWYYDAVREVCFNGFMKGISDKSFAPDEYITRAQAAQLIVNVQKKNDEIIKILTDQIEELREEIKKK